MKRLKLASNPILSIYRTETDTGQTIGFEICNDTARNSVLASFSLANAYLALQAFVYASDILISTGQRPTRQRVRHLVDRSCARGAETGPLN